MANWIADAMAAPVISSLLSHSAGTSIAYGRHPWNIQTVVKYDTKGRLLPPYQSSKKPLLFVFRAVGSCSNSFISFWTVSVTQWCA